VVICLYGKRSTTGTKIKLGLFWKVRGGNKRGRHLADHLGGNQIDKKIGGLGGEQEQDSSYQRKKNAVGHLCAAEGKRVETVGDNTLLRHRQQKEQGIAAAIAREEGERVIREGNNDQVRVN